MRRSQRGFSLIEVMVALAVLGIAMIGSIAGLLTASAAITDGQMAQYKSSLAEVHALSMTLMDRTAIQQKNQGQTYSGPDPSTLAPGTSPWALDATGDGAFFRIPESGVVTPVTLSALNCGDTSIPVGVYCREVMLTNKLPNGAVPTATAGWTNVLSHGTQITVQPYTVWTRIIRSGDPMNKAVVLREVILQ
jgi:prepilin-type N-terminal cleavage/methylation domain-containing protein